MAGDTPLQDMVLFDPALGDFARVMTGEAVLPTRRAHVALGECLGAVASDTGSEALVADIALKIERRVAGEAISAARE